MKSRRWVNGSGIRRHSHAAATLIPVTRWPLPRWRTCVFVLLIALGGESRAQDQHDVRLISEAFVDADSDGIPDRKGATATISGVLTSTPVAQKGKWALVNIQDGSGGVVLFTRNEEILTGKVQRGDLVIATGEVALYRGNRELLLKDAHDIRVLGRGVLPEPRPVPVSDLLSRRYAGGLVRVRGSLDVGPDFLSKKESVVLRDATGRIHVLISDRFFTGPEFLERFQKGGGIELIGIAGLTKDAPAENSDYQIIPRDAADFHFVTILPYREIFVAAGFVALSGLVCVAVVRRRRADRRVREVSTEAKRLADERDSFFSLSLDMLCIASCDGYFKRLNPAFAHTLGWSIEDLLARPFLDFVHPDDRAATMQAVANLSAGDLINSFENRHRCKDGTWRILSWKAVPRLDGVIYATARDVTDQREAEAALRGLNQDLERRVNARTAEIRQALATLDASEDGAFIFDPQTLRFSYVNEGAVRQLGYSRSELLALTPIQIMTEWDEARFRALLTPVIRGERRSQPLTTFHRRKDGREIPVEMNLQYVALPGEPARFINIVRDITERRNAERIAQRSQRLESLGTLAGGVAHDLNNALTPIVMGVEMLKLQGVESPLIESFQVSAHRATDMVRQLLTFAKGADGHHLTLQPSRIVKEIQQIIKYTFPKNIRLEVKCAVKLPCVRGDLTQLHQVLLNLCVNARDAMSDGGTLTLEAQAIEVDAQSAGAVPEAQPGHYVVLRVSDTGTGIAPEILERIFDPFFTTKGPDKGTGLGLSTVIGILKGHGGFLQVYSHVGSGSTFSAFLPAEGAADSVLQADPAAVPFRGEKESVLVVDDEDAVRDVALLVLRDLNFSPLAAVDGQDGLAQVARHQKKLRAIITDLHMPTMDGVAFIRAVRRILPDLPIVVTSGRMDENEKQECRKWGVTAELEKPFTEQQLAVMLKQILPPHRQRESVNGGNRAPPPSGTRAGFGRACS